MPMKSLRPIEPPLPCGHRTTWVPLSSHYRRRSLPPPPTQFPLPAVTVAASSASTSLISAVSTRAPPVETHLADGPHKRGPLLFEEQIEKVIYRCRFLTMFGVIGSLMGSILCFLKGCVYVINSFGENALSGGKVIMLMVEAIDVYLLGTVMLVFGMGLYELFISNLDIVKTSSYGSNLLGLFQLSERPKWLKIQSVNELKTKLGHVIVMILLVGLFEKSKKVTISSPGDLLCFAASILLSSVACISCQSSSLLNKVNMPDRSSYFSL